MINPTLTVSIDRSGMEGAPAPLVFSGIRGTALTIVSFNPPASVARLSLATPNPFVHGQELRGYAEEQTLLGLVYFAGQVTTETQQQAKREEVKAAIKQLSFTITTQVSGAPAEVWLAQPGNQLLASGGREYADLANLRPKYVISVPVYPIPS